MAEEKTRIVVEAVDNASGVLGGIAGKLGSIATIAAGAAAAGFAALTVAVGKSVQVAADFETVLNRFSAVTGVAGDALAEFNSLALELGAKTQFSAAQAAEAMVELAKGGVTPAAIAAGTLEQTLALAAAGELELATAAEITAKQLGVWASTGTTAADVADQLSRAANASTVDVAGLAMGLAQVGGVAKVAGLSFEETTQAMALLAPAFGSASDAGTSFKTFLNNLVPTSKNAIALAIELGLAHEDASGKVRSAFFDASGSFVGMEQAAELLHKALSGLSQEQRSLALETLFGTDAQRAAAVIAEAGAEGYRRMGEAMSAAGSATEQAAARNRGFNFAMESLRGSIETVSIILGQKFLPIATRIIERFLIPAVNAFGDFIAQLDSTQSPVSDLANAFDQLMHIADAVVDAVVTNWPAIRTTIEPVVSAVTAMLNTVLLPMLQFLLEQANKIVAFFVENWPLIEPPVRTALTAIRDVIKAVLPVAVEVFRVSFEAIKLVVGTTLDAVLAIIKHVLILMNTDVGAELNKVKLLFVNKFNEILEWLRNLPSRFIEIGRNMINGLIEGLKERIRPLTDAFEKLVQNPLEGMKQILQIKSPSGLMREIGIDVVRGYIEGIEAGMRGASIADMLAAPGPALTPALVPALAGGVGDAGALAQSSPVNVTIHLDIGGETIQTEVIRIVGDTVRRERLARGV
jgi:TP901 family phage tail tape measure protein